MREKSIIIGMVLLVPIILVGIVLYMGTSDFLTLTGSGSSLPTVRIKDMNIRVEIADTAQKRKTGLSGRERLPENQGMLFVFDSAGLHGIWMKDMRFAIDILWLNREGTIIDLKRNVPPESYPSVFYPVSSAWYVLELPANYTELFSIKIGDTVAVPSKFQK